MFFGVVIVCSALFSEGPDFGQCTGLQVKGNPFPTRAACQTEEKVVVNKFWDNLSSTPFLEDKSLFFNAVCHEAPADFDPTTKPNATLLYKLYGPSEQEKG